MAISRVQKFPFGNVKGTDISFLGWCPRKLGLGGMGERGHPVSISRFLYMCRHLFHALSFYSKPTSLLARVWTGGRNLRQRGFVVNQAADLEFWEGAEGCPGLCYRTAIAQPTHHPSSENCLLRAQCICMERYDVKMRDAPGSGG